MTDTQFWVLALIGLVQCILLALILKRDMPPIATVSDIRASATGNTASGMHSHHIYGCKLVGGEWQDVEELRNGMQDPANHERMKFYLSNGSEHGIRWNDGRVEPGSDPTPAAEPID